MRIDKLLANMGYGSRTEVKKMLKKGQVSIDHDVVKDGKVKVDPDAQQIIVQGEKVEYRKYVYVMLNKPKGVISATEDPVDKCVTDLLADEYRLFNPFPVGRLDKDTEGLLLLTNDGQLAHELLSPKKKVDKIYWAKIDGQVSEEDVTQFRHGVQLDDGYMTKPGELIIIKSGPVSEIELQITEGKFHQVKRMFKAVGKKVVELKRLQMGSLKLDPSLSKGDYRELTVEELNNLKS
ncbi:pseudouridine synthase [Salinibacillus xinjiangensis]|uniref:Pseudouridine synthase n=1 Tax=Salinibacillus xinjiangensis TaxID=1229268 RepID=A0A6G1X9R4_9BACI|nr:pseudouridine synthase [Salinibacillus xinjiangensis]MRG87753.1 pseudouridine synthase [Salinibacillus xinjiangensis]